MNRSLFRLSVVLTIVAAVALPIYAADDALSLVPANAATVGMVKLGEMRTSPLSSMLFEHADRMASDGEAHKFIAETGLNPARDIDVLVVATSPRTALGSDADVLVIAEGRYNVDKLVAALIKQGAVKKNGYLLLPEEKGGDDGDHDAAIAFPTASLMLGGNERAVTAALAARANGGTNFRSAGTLGLDLARVDRNATAWALVDVTRASRLAKGGSITTGKGNSGDALSAAIKSVSTLAVWATDTGDSLQLGAYGVSGDAETLQLLEDTARGALSALRLAVKDKAPSMVSVLRRFDVSRKDDYVQIEGSVPASTLRELMAKNRASTQK